MDLLGILGEPFLLSSVGEAPAEAEVEQDKYLSELQLFCFFLRLMNK